jgi:hypothetical protein
LYSAVKYEKEMEERKEKNTSTRKSDVGTGTAVNEDEYGFEDFLRSGAVEEAVEWVANQTDDSDELADEQ